MSAFVMLICAVLASLAFGVLVAYGVCQALFQLLRGQSIAAARQREIHAAAPAQMVAEG